MGKYYFIFAFLLLIFGCGKGAETQEEVVTATAEDFVDPLFYSYMQTHYDTNNDNIFQSEEILAVKSLDLTKETYIFSLVGFEKFIALETLNISGLNLQSKKLEITNPKLWNLNCSNTGLTSLWVSKSHSLKVVDCSNNSIRELAFGAHLNLEKLDCSENFIYRLAFGKNRSLQELNCSKNDLVRIDTIYSKKLHTLNVYNNLRLSKLLVFTEGLQYLDCSATNLSDVEFRCFEKLKELECGEMLMLLDITKNKELEYLAFYVNNFSTLDITNNVNLKKIKITSSSANKMFTFYIKKGQNKPQVETYALASYEFQYK